MHPNSQKAYHELAYYTLSHPSAEFIHQYVVDTFTIQTADETNKPISIVFALAGLFLFSEKGFTGKQVQLAHIRMTKNKINWPELVLPVHRGTISIQDVLAIPEGNERDLLIASWCRDTWEHCIGLKGIITTVLIQAGVLDE
ncbi:MAG: DUF5946 family protein [Bacteroidota bacterium]